MKKVLVLLVAVIVLIVGCSTETKEIKTKKHPQTIQKEITLQETAWKSLDENEKSLVTVDFKDAKIKRQQINYQIQETLDFYYNATSSIKTKYNKPDVYSVSFPTSSDKIGTITYYFSTYDKSFLGRVNTVN